MIRRFIRRFADVSVNITAKIRCFLIIRRHIKKALRVEIEFMRIFNTNESFILQYEDWYECRLALDGVDTEIRGWYDMVGDIYCDFNSVLSSLADNLGIDTDTAYRIIVNMLYK